MENKKEKKQEEPKTNETSKVEEPEEPAEPIEEAEAEELEEEQPAETEKETEKLEEEVKTEEAPVPPEEEQAPPEEEMKPAEERKKEAEEEEIVEERLYTVPLGKAWIMPANKRAPRAMRMLKAFITKHMKMETRPETEEEEEEEPGRLIITNEVNLRIWSRGIEKPPRKIRVRAAKDKEGNVTVHLAEGD